ncbi:MAG TPA: hypothetical protein PKH77_04990 [Anaerolineae bacterium]|nr:hypothetical protein [Anaerolineae bacterium]
MGAIISPAAYTIYQGSAPTVPPGKSYAYLLAGNGVFKLAESAYLRALIPVAPGRVAGLPPLTPEVALRVDIQPQLWEHILADARRVAWETPREAMYHVRVNGHGVSVESPAQVGTAGHLAYQGGAGADVVMDVHSHCQMAAFFSGTDNADEQGFRIYGVIGRIFTQPEIRLRVGVYGDFWPIKAEEL